MHLAYLDPHPVPDRVPEAMQILQTADALAAIGVQVTLVTPEPPVGATVQSIFGRSIASSVRFEPILKPDERLPGFSRSNKRFYRRAQRWARNSTADAILVRNLKLAERLLRGHSAIPLFFETHEVFAQTYREEHPRRGLLKRMKLAALEAREGFVYRHASGLVALTRMLLDDVRSAYGASAPGTVAPDGVDLEAAREARRERPKNRRPVILYLGSLHPWKGVDTLVRAMVDVDNADLWIAGGNSRRIELLRRLASDLGVTHRVRFLGEIEPSRRFALINEADVCALPLADTSIGARYTSPLKLFEYMAMGKPIIASDLATIRAVLLNERDAVLVPPADPASLATALRRVAGDPELAGRLAASALKLSERYGWAARAAIVRDFIEKSIGHARN